MSKCPRAACNRVGTEIVVVDGAEISFCARHAMEERSLLVQRPKQPDPFGLGRARQAYTRMLPKVQHAENQEGPMSVTFNDLGEPTELKIGERRYRVFPK